MFLAFLSVVALKVCYLFGFGGFANLLWQARPLDLC
jgi:hypothetical protein